MSLSSLAEPASMLGGWSAMYIQIRFICTRISCFETKFLLAVGALGVDSSHGRAMNGSDGLPDCQIDGLPDCQIDKELFWCNYLKLIF